MAFRYDKHWTPDVPRSSPHNRIAFKPDIKQPPTYTESLGFTLLHSGRVVKPVFVPFGGQSLVKLAYCDGKEGELPSKLAILWTDVGMLEKAITSFNQLKSS
jgi:hypothetical protein